MNANDNLKSAASDPFSSTTDISKGATAATTDISKSVTGAPQKMKEAVVSYIKESWIVLLIVFSMILLVVIVIYIFYIVKKNHLQKVTLHPEVLNLANRSLVPYIISDTDATLSTVNGQEFSYSMWLFLANTYDITSDHKLVLQRGNSSGSRSTFSNNTSPVVALDKSSNSMFIGVSTTSVVQSNTLSQIFAKDSATQKYTSGYVIVNIPYIPLQRWVNVIVVVRDMNMYIYLDGDIYSIASVSDLNTTTSTRRHTIRGTSGDISLGDSLNPVGGYASYTQFFNYALTQKDVTSIYQNGPSKKSWLSILGLGNYAVRTPLYKLN